MKQQALFAGDLTMDTAERALPAPPIDPPEYAESLVAPTRDAGELAPDAHDIHMARIREMLAEAPEERAERNAQSDRIGAEWIDKAWTPLRRHVQAPIHGDTVTMRAVPQFLEQPLKMRRPRRIVLGQDLFRSDVPFDLVDQVFDVMRRARQHQFLVVTRNPERLLAWRHHGGDRHAEQLLSDHRGRALPNVWISISAQSLLYAHGELAALLEAPLP